MDDNIEIRRGNGCHKCNTLELLGPSFSKCGKCKKTRYCSKSCRLRKKVKVEVTMAVIPEVMIALFLSLAIELLEMDLNPLGFIVKESLESGDG
jgi:hypothetical protein